MPRYFFHASGMAEYMDCLGADLPDDAAAWSLALVSMGETLRDLNGPQPDGVEFVMTAVDENGRPVATVRLTGARHFGETS